MSPRIWFASSLIVCAIIAILCPRFCAADGPAVSAQPSVCTGLVPEDAFAAIVLYPHRVLSADAVAKSDIKSLLDDIAKDSGISPLEVEQTAVLIGPAANADNAARHGDFQMAVFHRLNKAHGPAELAKKTLETDKVNEVAIAGHKCFRRAEGVPTTGEVVCFLDETTFVIASESWLPKLFDAKAAKSMLIASLATLDPADDVTAIFTNSDAVKEMAKGIPPQAWAGPLSAFRAMPELLQAAKLTIRTNPDISLKLTLVGKDDESAGKLAEMVKVVQQIGRAMLAQIPPAETVPAEMRKNVAMATEVATKIVNGLVPRQNDKQVVVEIDKLISLDSLVTELLPSVMQARQRARQAQGMNNLKQFGLAMLNCEARDGHFPTYAIYSKDGKPLLSWRVYLLPFLERNDLFAQFHLDEPWDSEHNKPLIAFMPSIFASPNGKPLAKGETRYVVPVGKDTIFEGDKGIKIAQITDGTSNTILILEVGEDKAVTWTKPDDMDFDPQKPLAGLGTIAGATFSALFADGSVHVLKKDIDAETFRCLILRNDGHPIDWSELGLPKSIGRR